MAVSHWKERGKLGALTLDADGLTIVITNHSSRGTGWRLRCYPFFDDAVMDAGSATEAKQEAVRRVAAALSKCLVRVHGAQGEREHDRQL